jgi:hypothetical protein
MALLVLQNQSVGHTMGMASWQLQQSLVQLLIFSIHFELERFREQLCKHPLQ